MTMLYGYVSNTGAPEYDDIMQSDLPTEEKVKQIKMRGQAYRDDLDDQLRKDLAKQYAGAALEIGSAAIPFSAGARLAGLAGKGLSAGGKYLLSSGLSGGLSGGMFGFGRGLMEDENPFLTAGQDAFWGGLGGVGLGALTNPQRMLKPGYILMNDAGEPMNLYHGTPNAGFTDFNTPSHFTPNPDYAATYMNPGASSVMVKQTANNPGVYEVNLDVNKIFDTRNPVERNIFNNEYQAYYSPELSKKGLPDWMEAEDLIDWLKQKYPEYDTLIVDEGGVGGYGEAVKDRGLSYLPFNQDQIYIKGLKSEKPVDMFNETIKRDNWHKKQSNLIQETNPMVDNYHTGIRSSKDIKTPDEVFNIENFIEYPDFKYSDAVKARKNGFIKVYSSKPISEGGFVTPSKMNAKDYAGSGEIHEAIVPIKDIAWIDSTEGQYAPIMHKEYGLSNTPLRFTGKSDKMNGNTYNEIDLSKSYYRSVLDVFNNHLSPQARKQLEIY